MWYYDFAYKLLVAEWVRTKQSEYMKIAINVLTKLNNERIKYEHENSNQ